ncbi:hypothetical protein NMY22_g18444 [Coprinellus aureogranulatus]|nr:hypothetical protein NMY22_g18444 [Coprinellus aureogranulatus]
MEGREHMVRNEIAVLKRISSGHPNIVTLHDYFETAHNLYLCFDLCTGGELFDRICAKGNYYEADAADLVRTIFKAVKYIHEAGIVHRGASPFLPPRNLHIPFSVSLPPPFLPPRATLYLDPYNPGAQIIARGHDTCHPHAHPPIASVSTLLPHHHPIPLSFTSTPQPN